MSDFIKDALDHAEKYANNFNESFKKHLKDVCEDAAKFAVDSKNEPFFKEHGMSPLSKNELQKAVDHVEEEGTESPSHVYYNGRRLFDISKLSKSDGDYYLKQKVLLAWNAGTIEELLESWVEE